MIFSLRALTINGMGGVLCHPLKISTVIFFSSVFILDIEIFWVKKLISLLLWGQQGIHRLSSVICSWVFHDSKGEQRMQDENLIAFSIQKGVYLIENATISYCNNKNVLSTESFVSSPRGTPTRHIPCTMQF